LLGLVSPACGVLAYLILGRVGSACSGHKQDGVSRSPVPSQVFGPYIVGSLQHRLPMLAMNLYNYLMLHGIYT
jgi:hypothetical protein